MYRVKNYYTHKSHFSVYRNLPEKLVKAAMIIFKKFKSNLRFHIVLAANKLM